MSTDTLTEAEVAAIRYCLVHRTNMVSMTWPDAAARLLAERDALREALKFYAQGHHKHGDGHYHDTCDVCLDYGAKARAALGGK